MRGGDERSGWLFSYVDLEARVRKDHPLRTIREIVNEVLAALSGEFSAMYSPMGRPSIPPEKLLRAMLLQAFYSIRSERRLMERLEFDLLFRWFVGIGVDDAAWDDSTFSKNRDRLLEGEVAAKLLSAVLAQPRVKRLPSTDHFSVDGTLIQAWASMKSFKPKDGSEPPSEGRRPERSRIDDILTSLHDEVVARRPVPSRCYSRVARPPIRSGLGRTEPMPGHALERRDALVVRGAGGQFHFVFEDLGIDQEAIPQPLKKMVD